ncbi:MAG: sigma-70 family RNA polymerase sigma factor [Ignavibacteriae bacterium]|nr:sigma-70 family RNA polymerase sigma factor [Ignavibacteriota bacterium]MCB9215092.1 sigma-70 family RNA polymerase sigma factor [Ignavibacteria bacterium]
MSLPDSISKEERSKQNRAEDHALVRRALDGDQAAFARLRDKYQGSLNAMLFKMVRNQLDAEDLTQEAFIKAFSSLKSFNFQYAFSTWLYKIASNNCIDYLRKRRLKTVSYDEPIRTSKGEMEMQLPDADAPLPDAPMTAKERTEILKQAIADLPEKYRVVIELRHNQEMEYQDIAEELDLPLGTVKAHLFRARARLLKALQGKMEHFEE